jgi:tetratricopeptide (TPR) repeat protein
VRQFLNKTELVMQYIQKLSKSSLLFVCLWALTHPSAATEPSELDILANQYFQQNDWTKVIQAYQPIVAEQPKNYRAWYRLGIAYVENKQAEQALIAFEKATQDNQIPVSLIFYQSARANKQLNNTESMWAHLEQAVQSGYRSLTVIAQEPLWDDVRDSATFNSLLVDIDKTIRPCVYNSQYNDFDFWLGKWEVYSNAKKQGPLIGNSEISKEQQNCLIIERWDGAVSSTGTSMNFYDGIKGKWVQHWQSNSGTNISIEGGLTDGSMILTGKIYYPNTEKNPVRHFRGTWTSTAPGVVRQFFEESIDKGQTWYPWFEGFYFKQESLPETQVIPLSD